MKIAKNVARRICRFVIFSHLQCFRVENFTEKRIPSIFVARGLEIKDYAIFLPVKKQLSRNEGRFISGVANFSDCSIERNYFEAAGYASIIFGIFL